MQKYKIFFLDHRSYCLNSLGDSLAQMGHEIFYQSSWISKEVEAGIAYFRPDILITVGFNYSLFGGFLEKIPDLCKKYHLYHIYWATEDIIHYESWSLKAVQTAKPDYVLTIHPDCVEKYNYLGIPASYFNFAINPRLFPKKSEEDVETFDIALIGNAHLIKRTYRYESLEHLLFPLINHNITTHVWGSGWYKHRTLIKQEFKSTVPQEWLRGPLPYKSTSAVYRASKIVLGIQNAEHQVTQRTFEILGTGAFMIASRTPALQEMFVENEDLVLTSSPEETIELVNYYLNQTELRHKIGNNARKKTLDNYTYCQQIEKVWPNIEPLINQKLNIF
ncbi:hypothetical protein BHU72_13075 [Desulfuribacillus stibiiarsenatis]|uniref:DUF3880 domain-containing protein n=1 Tax=Desulfuribacillus stibiiarsenatis TaxID=1390249 RepID=A0A1E5L8T0_9FIRM|nr:glycosyltransferase [Desulfuribacillus stibiiarsenatis]OEH86536.1 hypothetical protein BHU72_13075 [Desulfuribacillus stibiiarsenatis]